MVNGNAFYIKELISSIISTVNNIKQEHITDDMKKECDNINNSCAILIEKINFYQKAIKKNQKNSIKVN